MTQKVDKTSTYIDILQNQTVYQGEPTVVFQSIKLHLQQRLLPTSTLLLYLHSKQFIIMARGTYCSRSSRVLNPQPFFSVFKTSTFTLHPWKKVAHTMTLQFSIFNQGR